MPNEPHAETASEALAALTAAPEGALLAEAEALAHDRISPDRSLEPLAAVDLYVEAFLGGARYALAYRGGCR